MLIVINQLQNRSEVFGKAGQRRQRVTQIVRGHVECWALYLRRLEREEATSCFRNSRGEGAALISEGLSTRLATH